MKGLKKVALASAIAAVSAGAQAELKALDDATMGELTGQAGLTIDIETSFTIGEFQYRDQDATAPGADNEVGTGGSVLIRGISQGGNTLGTDLAGNANSSLLDNIRLTLDVAGADAADNNSLNYGFSEIGRLSAFLANPAGPVGNTDPLLQGNAGVAGTLAAGGFAQFTDFGADGTASLDADLGVAQWGLQGRGGAAVAAEFGLDPVTGAPVNLGTSENGSDAAGIEDGDLVLHFGFTDAFAAGGGFDQFLVSNGAAQGATGLGLADLTWVQARDIATRAVDYNFSIDAIALASSGYTVGDLARDLRGDATNTQDNQTTVLISDLDIRGFLGPRDIHIENDGNGFGADGTGLAGAPAGVTGDADSKITISNYFRVTDLDVYIDIAGVALEGVQIKNTRGDLTGLDGTSSFGFAHSRQTIFAVEETVLALGESSAISPGAAFDNPFYASGIQINTEFKGDIDIDAIRFGGIGEGASIGQIFLTDIDSVSNWTISAHD